MSRRSMVRRGVFVGLLLALVVVLWPQPAAPSTVEERTLALAGQLRCPYCNGESIAEAPSAIARDLQDYIGEQVVAGRTEDEIIDFFIGRYGEQVLLNPPFRGWGLWLWLLPVLALGGGLVVIGKRVRRADLAQPTDAGAVAEQLTAIDNDLADIEMQVVAGDLAADDAVRLRDAYRSEADGLAELDLAGTTGGLDRKRMLIGAGVLVLGGLALTAGVVAVAHDRAPNDLITGGLPETSLENVTNEEMELVVAQNPNVIGMRLRLAERYFEEADFSSAYPHYLYILQQQDNAEALANMGWMTFLSGDAETGERFVTRSLEVDADHLQSYWYLANIRWFGYADGPGAIAPLERLLAAEGVPDDVRTDAETLLGEARSAT